MKSRACFVLSVSLILLITIMSDVHGQSERPRDYGIDFGVLQPGELNAITDVPYVKVGQITLKKGDSVRTGVTSILPHDGNIFQQKVPAAIYVGNGFGKLTGYTQVRELGNLETPVVLTNTLSVPTAANAVIEYTLHQEGNENVESVNPVVGETNDGGLNDIRGRHVEEQHVLDAIHKARGGEVQEGNTGAGTGTTALGFKGGIGTSSRVLPESKGGYTVGALVQTNFGGILSIDGVPVGEELDEHYMNDALKGDNKGSCMMVIATNAPLDSRNLERLAKRAILGMARTGGIATNGSGDYVIAFSTNRDVRIKHSDESSTTDKTVLRNDSMSPLFLAAVEATEEAIINSLFAAETATGYQGYSAEALPVDKVIDIMQSHNMLHNRESSDQ